MEEELRSLIRVWGIAVPAALTYCYTLPPFIKPGKLRLLAVVPVIVLFFYLPFSFSTIHLRFNTACFLSGVAVFKILLFAFDRGPLCSTTPLSLPGFIAVASFNIRIQRSPSRRAAGEKISRSLGILVFAIKGFLFGFVVSMYPLRHKFHRGFVLALYSLHLYLEADLTLNLVALMCRAMLPAGTVLEPQFDAPYLSSSLQEFWGRRWNLAVTRLLRETVYDPVRSLYGAEAGMLSTFFVSALMHEVLWVYLTLERPTGEVSLFFILHGFCTTAEVVVKRWWARRGLAALPRGLTAPLTVGFLMSTSWWLFIPPITRSSAEEQIVKEAEAIFQQLRWILAF